MLPIDNIFGRILEEIYLVQCTGSDDDAQDGIWIERSVLKFGDAFFVVNVNPDTDEVETNILDTFNADNRVIEVSRHPDNALFNLLGGKLSWVWTMTNNRGYTDGIQFEIGSKIVQFIAIASRLQINLLNSVETRSA